MEYATRDSIRRTLKGGKLTAGLLRSSADAARAWQPPDHVILVGTHHKTGTVWMNEILGRLSLLLGTKLYKNLRYDVPEDCTVLCDDHSRFNFALMRDRPYRGVHLIRDPRDVIVSACFYHQKSSEPWVNAPDDAYDGMSYRQKINSLDSLEEKLLFEMEGSAGRNIADMGSWNYDDPDFIEVKYEDLIEDHDLALFHRIFTFLGLGGSVLPLALQVAHDNSMFSGRLKQSVHRRSGKAAQWRQHFGPRHKERFLELFGDVLVELGYERDDRW